MSRQQTSATKKRKVLQLDKETYEVISWFESVAAAVKYTKVTNIDKAARGELSQAGGYLWIYENDYRGLTQEQLHERFRTSTILY